MLRNYLKIAIRNLLKRKGYSSINILGLASGMAACLLILLFIEDELSYDKFNKKGDNIYRMVLDRKNPGRSTSYSIIPPTIGEAVEQECPEVEESVRIFDFGGNNNLLIHIGDKQYEETNLLAADSNFFRVFTADLIDGDPATALQKPNTVVITESTARKYFGQSNNVVGKQILSDLNNPNTNVMITGVVKDWPVNSHFHFDLLFSTTSFPFTQEKNYTGFAAHTYLLLRPGASPQALEAKFPDVIKKYASGEINRFFGETFEQFQKAGNGYHYYLQPLKKIHLISNLEAELSTNGSLTAIYIFGIIAIFILGLACINFINLSTARSVERAKEVGVRKTFGSERKSLIVQFLSESVLVSFISMLVAVGLMFLLLPLFNQLSGKQLVISSFLSFSRIGGLLLFALMVGIAAGLYPAFVLSSFQPILVLKGRFKSNRYGLALRNSLVVFQFAISVILIIITIVVNQQTKYMLGDKIGFRKDHVVMIEGTGILDKQTEAFKNDLSSIPGVISVSSTNTFPGNQNFFGNIFQVLGAKEPVTGRGIVTDEQFADLLGLELTKGRFFSKSFASDSLAVVLNEKAVTELGLTNPIGARLTNPAPQFNGPDNKQYVYTVIGVVRDFHFQSLRQKVSPLFFNHASRFGNALGFMAVRISNDNFQSVIAGIQNKWKTFVKERPFHYSFLDKTVADQYLSENTMLKVFRVFSALAIFIACIGLLGLAAYSTQQRTREISIRKVLGATAGSIVSMLSKDFLKLVAIAALIAFPVAWFGINRWLQEFAYRIDMSWWVFLLAGSIAVIIALCTISFHALKAALANPAKSLNIE